MITEQDARTNISENIQDILVALGWNPRKLVIRSGVPQNTVYRVVRGESIPDVVHLKNIADALGVTVERLLENPENFRKVG